MQFPAQGDLPRRHIRPGLDLQLAIDTGWSVLVQALLALRNGFRATTRGAHDHGGTIGIKFAYTAGLNRLHGGGNGVLGKGIGAIDHPIIHPVLGLEILDHGHPNVFQGRFVVPRRRSDGNVGVGEIGAEILDVVAKRGNHAPSRNGDIFHGFLLLFYIICHIMALPPHEGKQPGAERREKPSAGVRRTNPARPAARVAATWYRDRNDGPAG